MYGLREVYIDIRQVALAVMFLIPIRFLRILRFQHSNVLSRLLHLLF